MILYLNKFIELGDFDLYNVLESLSFCYFIFVTNKSSALIIE